MDHQRGSSSRVDTTVDNVLHNKLTDLDKRINRLVDTHVLLMTRAFRHIQEQLEEFDFQITCMIPDERIKVAHYNLQMLVIQMLVDIQRFISTMSTINQLFGPQSTLQDRSEILRNAVCLIEEYTSLFECHKDTARLHLSQILP
ncbi:hypothetical protein L2E82_37750 [Cichorium intybus]|uniref:Uncharacterized protein n=1 Tax=Cichorium intybus TaxID=13427 RepID=A0ACB9AFC3_CICIN|nr:hypothetical protein L2E82_37750 [Cichorium intybus]